MNSLRQAAALIKSTFTESPEWKATLSIVLSIVTGILSGPFVTEITVDGRLLWRSFYKAHSFYLLVVLSILIFIYNRFLYLREKDIEKFRDAEYCLAYMRSKCLPEAADRFIAKIRDGDLDEFRKAMDEVKGALK